MGAAVGGKKGGIKSDINVTPLVDIVLVLLIIFIVITPAVNDSVKLPIAKHSPKVEKNPGTKYLTIFYAAHRDAKGEVDGPGSISMDDKDSKTEKFSLDTPERKQKFEDFVNKNISAQGGDNRVFVKADADLPFKYINELFQSCRKGGADEAQIVTGDVKDAKKEGGH
jgi:biopolymer transport protein ExbD